jgi:hypothetical protein
VKPHPADGQVADFRPHITLQIKYKHGKLDMAAVLCNRTATVE